MINEIFQRNIQFWGENKQKILNKSSILIAGMGGLGCVVSQILIRAGISKLILIDNSIIEESDLNRQILFTKGDIGKLKVKVAYKKLKNITHLSEIISLNYQISNSENLKIKLKDIKFNGIADCLDNFTARFELEKLMQPDQFLVHGGVQNDFGQITTIKTGKTQSLEEIYPGLHIPAPIPIIPQTVNAIGSLMAQEIINNLFDKPQLMNKMLILELVDFSMFKVEIGK